MSRRNDAPEKACRPFERDRDGLVVGEGAGVFALEDLEHAQKRGARIYGEMVGFGAAFSPDLKGDGLARAVRAAMNEAGIGPEEVDHVNAHGLSSRPSDEWEARNLQSVFGSSNTPVIAVKSYIGNLGAAGGATELAASVLGLHHGEIPGTLNYDDPDPDCPVQVGGASVRRRGLTWSRSASRRWGSARRS